MATDYTTWAQVLDLWPRASQVEKFDANQTALITAKCNLFQSYIRLIHKEDLLSPYDEIVKMTVANLVIDELKTRNVTDDSELIDVEYDHFMGRVTKHGAAAHSTIDAIRRGAVVLGQDTAAHDVHHPRAIPASGNTSAGKVEVYLPHEYKSDAADEYLIKISTAGRVDDADATFDVFVNNNATAASTGNTCGSAWAHLGYELYVRFLDQAQTADQFVINNTWTITVHPSTTESRTTSPRTFDLYAG